MISPGQIAPAKVSHWAKGTYTMVAEVISKVARYDDGEVEGAASENARVRLIIATAFADRFEADNARFDRSRFLKACNDARGRR